MDQVTAGAKFNNLIGFVEAVRPIITAVENTTGIVVRTCTASNGKLVTGAVTPVPTNGEVTEFPVVFFGLGSPSFEIVVPAGQGLWWAPNDNPYSPSYIYITYDVLA